MIAVIFEVAPEPPFVQEYLDLAAGLRAELDTIDGFLSVERYASLSRPGYILSFPSGATKMRWRTGVNPHRTGRRRCVAATACSSITACGWRTSCATTESATATQRHPMRAPCTGSANAVALLWPLGLTGVLSSPDKSSHFLSRVKVT